MIKIEFERPLTTFEVRDPAIEVCEEVATALGYYANFHQQQQRALSGNSGQLNRERIGNAKHKNWHIDYQKEELRTNRPTVVGRVVLASATIPEIMQYGGFGYSPYGEPELTYEYITVDVPNLPNMYSPIMPTEEMVDLTYKGLQERFAS